MFTQAMGMTASDWSVSDVVKTRQGNYLLKSYFFLSQKLLFSVLILWLKAKCLLKNFSTLAFFGGGGGTNTSVKFVAKITCLFRRQIDPLIIFGPAILNFIAGLA